MIIIFVGNQGGGKTISIVRQLLIDYKTKDRKIMTNFSLNDKIPYKLLTKQMLKDYSKDQEQILNVSIGLTELHTLVDSRSSGKNKLLTWFFLQTRKRGVTLYGDSQHFGQIDKRIRDETDIFVECSAYLLDEETNKLNFTTKKEFTEEEQELLYIKNKCYIKVIENGIRGYKIQSEFFKAKEIFEYYDTYEVVNINE